MIPMSIFLRISSSIPSLCSLTIICSGRMSYWTVLFDAYDREDSTANQKDAAFKSIYELIYKFEGDGVRIEIPEEVCVRMVDMCCSVIGRHAVTNEVVSGLENWEIAMMMEGCLSRTRRAAAETSPAINLVINEDGMMDWICEGIESEDEHEHTEFAYLLVKIFDLATEWDRMTLCVRHPNRCHKAAYLILTRHAVLWGDYFNSVEMAGFLAMEPIRFARLVSKWTERNYDRNVCTVVIYVLEASLESPKTLEILLGYRLLWVARHYSLTTNAFQGSVEAAHVFTKILDKFPGWKRQFREWTKDGVEGNPTADLGRSITPKIATPGVDFVWYDEDEDNF